MKNRSLGVAVAVTTLVALPAGAQAGPSLHAGSFAELLEPIPNASQQLSLLDRAEPGYAGLLMKAQYRHHHHHHHRHHHGRRTQVSHHHHHHHHENGSYGRRTRAVPNNRRQTNTRGGNPYGERG